MQYSPDTKIANHRKLIMTLLVRNEEDIVRYNIDFHLSKGVDFIIATDNGSTDSTRDILKEYEARGVLHLIDEKTLNHDQARWNNRMAKIARDRYGADIIFHCDADEFWYPRSGSLKDEIAGRPEDILIVDMINILLVDKGGDEAFPQDARFAVVNPIVAYDYIEETKKINLFYFKYPPKVIFKAAKKLLHVAQGNHSVTNKDDSIGEGTSRDIIIYHYPIRSKAHFLQKTILGGSAYESSDIHPKDNGFHKKRWYASYKEGSSDKEYGQLIIDDKQVEGLLRDGFVEEIAFENLILGAEKDISRWQYFNCEFELEQETPFPDGRIPWTGHHFFAYDLVRNVRPKSIAVLGVSKGLFLETLCKATEDAFYDAKLFAINPWREEESAGCRDDFVGEAEKIKAKYDDRLKIKLLRNEGDQVACEFENGSIDLLLIGGLHGYETVKHAFEVWFPKVSPGGIILLPDIFVHRDPFGAYQFWEELRNQRKTIEFPQSRGLGVVFKDGDGCQAFLDQERKWRIHYSSVAKERKDEEIEKSLDHCHELMADCDERIAQFNHALTECRNRISDLESVRTEHKSTLALIDFMKHSKSWRLTRPLRFLARLLRYGLIDDDRSRLTQGLRAWYHRLPLPVSLRKTLSRLNHRISGKIASVQHTLTLTHQKPFCPPATRPACQQEGLPDYIVWGVIDWHFRIQRPQQLAMALSKKARRILYISPHFIDDERAGFIAERLDASGLLFQVNLFVKGAPVIYDALPEAEVISQLTAGIGEVLDWADCRQLVSLVQHPFWYDVASVLPNSRLVYDCMDHHDGFGNNSESLIELEKLLIRGADLTITTSTWLDESIAKYTQNRAMIRNACDYEHFSKMPDEVYCDPQGRRIIGYYGAIAEWFDPALVEAVAKRHPDCCIMLIGADSASARARLARLPNVVFTGEIPYGKLPYYLYAFDVCLLPFKVVPLTLATNPVKVYEYLSAGKPVVTVSLPEMTTQFDGLVYAAAEEKEFLAAVDGVLAQAEPQTLLQSRKDFASGQTWTHRGEELIGHVESAARDPKVSVIVITYNNLHLTRECLESLHEHSHYENLEIIVVDNASGDDSPDFLKNWAACGQNRKIILNDDNRGFAAANNQGLSAATGDYLVMLNNDTYATQGWIRTLQKHLQRDETIGLIGPVTNNIGNEAKIDITYSSMSEMLSLAAAYTRRHIGETLPLRTAAFFCAMMSRGVYERAGALDEAFGRGFFEDDDYCRRVEQLGLRIVCAEDVFIHHHLSASFDQLPKHDREKLFEESKKIYEAKWGTWVRHVYRKRT